MAQTSTTSLSVDRGALAIILLHAGNFVLSACQYLPDLSLGPYSLVRKKEWVRSIKERFTDTSEPSKREAPQVGTGAGENGEGEVEGTTAGKRPASGHGDNAGAGSSALEPDQKDPREVVRQRADE